MSSSTGVISAGAPKKVELLSVTVRNYEVQRYASGRWIVDSVADERDVAIAVAQSLLRSARAPHGVRVMAVQTKPSGEYSQVTIFRRVPGEPEPAPSAPVSRPAPKTDVKPASEKRDFKHVDPPAKPAARTKGRFAAMMLALKIAFIVGFAVVAFAMIHLLGR